MVLTLDSSPLAVWIGLADFLPLQTGDEWASYNSDLCHSAQVYKVSMFGRVIGTQKPCNAFPCKYLLGHNHYLRPLGTGMGERKGKSPMLFLMAEQAIFNQASSVTLPRALALSSWSPLW